jgi:hypothetical protein
VFPKWDQLSTDSFAPMPPNRRDVMFAFAASAAFGGCATPGGQPAADWQQFGAVDGTTIH